MRRGRGEYWICIQTHTNPKRTPLIIMIHTVHVHTYVYGAFGTIALCSCAAKCMQCTCMCTCTLSPYGHTPPCQLHRALMATLLHASCTEPLRPHSSMPVAPSPYGHTPPCQLRRALTATLLHASCTEPLRPHSSVPITYDICTCRSQWVQRSSIVVLVMRSLVNKAHS